MRTFGPEIRNYAAQWADNYQIPRIEQMFPREGLPSSYCCNAFRNRIVVRPLVPCAPCSDATCLVENVDEAMDVAERVVQRCWCDSKHIRLALIHHHATFFDVMQHLVQQAGLQKNAELCAPLGWVRLCDDLVSWLAIWVFEKASLEICSQVETALSQGFHVGQRKDI